MSPQKHAAQISNAQRSRGAVTEAGRLRSSANSTRHGLASRKLRIIPPEDREEFDQHCSDMLPALAPEGPIENYLADLVVFDEWRLIRIRGLENEIFAMGFTTAKDQFFAGAETWLAKSKELATLTLYEQRIARVLSGNKAELEARQSARKTSGADLLVGADGPSPEAFPTEPAESSAAEASLPAPEATPETAPEITGGFVRSSAASAPPAATQTLTQAAAGGFVHSSDAPPLIPAAKRPESPTPDPRPLTPGREAGRHLPPAAKRPGLPRNFPLARQYKTHGTSPGHPLRAAHFSQIARLHGRRGALVSVGHRREHRHLHADRSVDSAPAAGEGRRSHRAARWARPPLRRQQRHERALLPHVSGHPRPKPGLRRDDVPLSSHFYAELRRAE